MKIRSYKQLKDFFANRGWKENAENMSFKKGDAEISFRISVFVGYKGSKFPLIVAKAVDEEMLEDVIQASDKAIQDVERVKNAQNN